MQYILFFLKFACTKSLECNWWLNHSLKVHDKTTQLLLDFLCKIPCDVKAELSVVLWQWGNTKIIFLKNDRFETWYPQQNIFTSTHSHIFPAFCTHFTVLVIFSNNNNDRKGKYSSKILYEEIEVFLKTSANIITLGVFFSLYSRSFLTNQFVT